MVMGKNKKNKKNQITYEGIFCDGLNDHDDIISEISCGLLKDNFCEGGLESYVTAADIAAADPFSINNRKKAADVTGLENVIKMDDDIILKFEPVRENLTLQKIDDLMEEEQIKEIAKLIGYEPTDESKSVQIKKQKNIVGYGFSEVENRVIENNHIFCHNGDLYYFNDRCYSKLNDKVLLAKITKEMSIEQRNDFNFRRNRSNIMAAIKENDAIDLQINKIKPTKSIITFRNGNLNVETGEFYGHSSDELTVYEVNANYLENVNYLPTPTWNDYVTSAVKGSPKEVMRFINTILGYLLIPGAPAKKFFVFGTAPDSGKSVFGDFLTFLLGDENVSGVELHEFQRNFMFSGIAGMVANVAMDLPDEPVPKKAASRLKSTSGHDKIQMEKKYQDSFKLGIETKFVFGANAPIRLVKYDKAFYNRMVVVPFMNSVPEEEQNWNLLDDLKAERDYIVTKAMRAVMKLRRNNYVFPTIEASTKLHHEWSRSETDIIADTINEFAKDCCLKTDDPSDFITVDELFDNYLDFCMVHNYKAVQRTLFPQLMGKFFPKKRGNYTQDGARNQPRGFNFIKVNITKEE